MKKMGKDPLEMIVQMIVEQAKMSDEQFKKTGVENRDFKDSLMY